MNKEYIEDRNKALSERRKEWLSKCSILLIYHYNSYTDQTMNELREAFESFMEEFEYNSHKDPVMVYLARRTEAGFIVSHSLGDFNDSINSSRLNAILDDLVQGEGGKYLTDDVRESGYYWDR